MVHQATQAAVAMAQRRQRRPQRQPLAQGQVVAAVAMAQRRLQRNPSRRWTEWRFFLQCSQEDLASIGLTALQLKKIMAYAPGGPKHQ